MKKRAILIEIIIWLILLTMVSFILFFAYLKVCVEPNVYNVDFRDIDGITKGSPVRFMGLNIGHVRSLKSRGKHVKVQIIITLPNIKIPQGTTARVEFYGLGGSKSIELMPPDDSCDVGIITGHTIRINEVAREVFSIVEIIEGLDKYVKGLNKSKVQTILETVEKLEDTKITDTNKKIDGFNSKVSARFNNVKTKQHNIIKQVNKTNDNVNKVNKHKK